MIDINNYVGKKVRAFDFDPSAVGEELYVEGVVTAFDGEMITIKVEFDSAFSNPSREIVKTPIDVGFMDWVGRIVELS